MNKKYEKPDMNITSFNSEDIITLSGGDTTQTSSLMKTNVFRELDF